MTQINLKQRFNAAEYHFSLFGNSSVFSFLRSSKLTSFLTTCLSATLFQILTFSAFLYISERARQNYFRTSSHNLYDVYNNV